MAQENQGTGIFAPVLFVWLVSLVVGLPVNGTFIDPPRSSSSETQAEGAAGLHGRLWEDPLTMAQGLEPRENEQKSAPVPPTQDPAKTSGAAAGADASGNPEGLALIVPLPGLNYTEYIEYRRRQRYAVQAALWAKGYVRVAPAIEDRISSVAMPLRSLATEDPGNKAKYLNIPYESYTSSDTRKGLPGKVRVFYLNTHVVSQVFDGSLHLFQQHVPQGWRLALTGPPSTDGLTSLLAEGTDFPDTGARDLFLQEKGPVRGLVNVYNTQATGRRPELNKENSWTAYRRVGKDDLERIARIRQLVEPDSITVSKILSELALRNAEPGKESGLQGRPGKMAILTEWETAFGREFAQSVKNLYPGSESVSPVVFYHYLRGIDGQAPARRQLGAYPASKSTESEARRAQSAGEAVSRAIDPLPLPPPEGPGQFDYLARFGQDLRDEDSRHRRWGKGTIRAIGLISTDVEDKLALLKTLRPHFPSAVYFTNEMEADFLLPVNTKFTRNLLVASHYGLECDKLVWGRNVPEIRLPAFRSSTQVALVDAVWTALREFGELPAAAPQPPGNHALTSAHLQKMDKAEEPREVRLMEMGIRHSHQLRGPGGDKVGDFTPSPAGLAPGSRLPDIAPWVILLSALSVGWAVIAGMRSHPRAPLKRIRILRMIFLALVIAAGVKGISWAFRDLVPSVHHLCLYGFMVWTLLTASRGNLAWLRNALHRRVRKSFPSLRLPLLNPPLDSVGKAYAEIFWSLGLLGAGFGLVWAAALRQWMPLLLLGLPFLFLVGIPPLLKDGIRPGPGTCRRGHILTKRLLFGKTTHFKLSRLREVLTFNHPANESTLPGLPPLVDDNEVSTREKKWWIVSLAMSLWGFAWWAMVGYWTATLLLTLSLLAISWVLIVPKTRDADLWWKVALLVLGCMAVLSLLKMSHVAFAGRWWASEPMAMSDGVCVWPAVALRLVAALVAAQSLKMAWAEMRAIRDECTQSVFLVKSGNADSHSPEKLVARGFPDYTDLRQGTTPGAPAPGRYSQKNEALEWCGYLEKTDPFESGNLRRAARWTLIGMLVSAAIMTVFGFPTANTRGLPAGIGDWFSLLAALVCLTFLCVFVAGQIHECRRFFLRIWRHSATAYGLEMEETLLLVARISGAAGNLIIYPFCACFILLCAHFSFFEQWSGLQGLYGMLFLGLGSLLLCTWRMQKAAQTVRSKTINALKLTSAEALWLKRLAMQPPPPGPVPEMSQDESPNTFWWKYTMKRLGNRMNLPEDPHSLTAFKNVCESQSAGREQDYDAARKKDDELHSMRLERIKQLMELISNFKEGAFGGWHANPMLRAVLIPGAGLGSLELLQKLLG